MNKKWQQLVISISSPNDAELISDFLNNQGALAITFQDAADTPLYEPDIGSTPLWENTCIKALFSEETDIKAITELLLDSFSELSLDCSSETILDEDWQHTWKKDFTPLHVGKHLWVVPSWFDPPDRDAVNIRLDPGLAFGTGTHPTTQLCLKWLASHDLKDKTIIDYGCGSGILAIAAIKLGAKQAWAVDIDPQALESTQSNAKVNNIPATQIISVFPEDLPAIDADVIIANILANPLIQLAPILTSLCKPQGVLVLSGLLKEQAELIINHYQNFHPLIIKAELKGWILLGSADNTIRPPKS